MFDGTNGVSNASKFAIEAAYSYGIFFYKRLEPQHIFMENTFINFLGNELCVRYAYNSHTLHMLNFISPQRNMNNGPYVKYHLNPCKTA